MLVTRMVLVRVGEFTVEHGRDLVLYVTGFPLPMFLVAKWCKVGYLNAVIFVRHPLSCRCVGLEHVIFPEHLFSKDHISAGVLEHFEGDWYFQAVGKGPCRVHLANRFLKSAVGELQEAPILGSRIDV